MPAPDTLTGLIGRSIDLRAQSAHRREVSIMLMAQTNELMATAAEIYEDLAVIRQRVTEAREVEDAWRLGLGLATARRWTTRSRARMRAASSPTGRAAGKSARGRGELLC
jgi:hypothetical protein